MCASVLLRLLALLLCYEQTSNVGRWLAGVNSVYDVTTRENERVEEGRRTHGAVKRCNLGRRRAVCCTTRHTNVMEVSRHTSRLKKRIFQYKVRGQEFPRIIIHYRIYNYTTQGAVRGAVPSWLRRRGLRMYLSSCILCHCPGRLESPPEQPLPCHGPM